MDIPAKTFYETNLTAIHNVRLVLVRKVDQVKCYCIAYTKNWKRKTNFDGYYFQSELKKILTP